MSKVEALLQGFVDTHVHAGPTLTVREFDIWQLIREAEAGGFAAVVLKDDMKNWQSLGAYLEFTAVISLPSSPIYCRPVEGVAGLIKKLDPRKIVLSSDLGLKNAGWPVEGMSVFLKLLLEAGVASNDLKHMITLNPAALMGLKQDAN